MPLLRLVIEVVPDFYQEGDLPIANAVAHTIIDYYSTDVPPIIIEAEWENGPEDGGVIPGLIVPGWDQASKLVTALIEKGYEVWWGGSEAAWAAVSVESPAAGVFAVLAGAPHPIVGHYDRVEGFVPRDRLHKVVW